MSGYHRISVLFVGAALSSAAVGFFPILPSSAQSQQDIDRREGKGGATTDLQIKACDAAIRSAPPGTNLEWAYAHRAWAYHRAGDLDRAITDVNEAIWLNRKNVSYLTRRCEICRLKKEFERAMADCLEATRLDSAECDSFFYPRYDL
jgi:hypothetical protein